jgi:hypothetical protein
MNKQATLITTASAIATYTYAMAIEDKEKDSRGRFSTTAYTGANEDFNSLLANLLGHFWENLETLEQNIQNDAMANEIAQNAADMALMSDMECEENDSCRAS